MKSKMSPRRAEDCKELKSILSDNRINTLVPKNRDYYYNFTNSKKWDQYIGDFKEDGAVQSGSSKCLKRSKEVWKGDKTKKFKFDLTSTGHFKEHQKMNINEIVFSKTSNFLHNKSGAFYPPISNGNDASFLAPGFDISTGISGPLTFGNQNESETETRNKMGNSLGPYFQNQAILGHDKPPECNFSTANNYLPQSLATNLYGDCGSLNDYYNYYYYHHHHYQPHHLTPSTPIANGKDASYTWDYVEPSQFNSYSHFGVKSLPTLDWSQYGDQWYALSDRVDQCAQGESGLYYPFCHPPACYSSNALAQKHSEPGKIELVNSKQILNQPTADDHENRKSEHQILHYPNSLRRNESMEAVPSSTSSSSSLSVSSASSSACYKSCDVDSTWSPNHGHRNGSKSLSDRVLDLRTCPPEAIENVLPHNWLAVDKTLVEDLIDTIMAGSRMKYNNINVNYREDNIENSEEETSLAVL